MDSRGCPLFPKTELLERTPKIILNKSRCPVIIRRTRLDLNALEEYCTDLEKQNIVFPRVEDPVCLSYELGELSDRYMQTLLKIAPVEEEDGS
ncbi:MAG: hypothetical protein GY757_33805, partial [bacterium]|nr:hypothetical protein [bacterium]